MRKLVFCIAALCMAFCGLTSCSDTEEIKTTTDNIITAKPLAVSSLTRATGDNAEYGEAYQLSSTTTTMVTNTYLSTDYNSAVSMILNKNGEEAYYLRFVITGENPAGGLDFTAFNEDGDPILDGNYNEPAGLFGITKVYGKDVITRASAAFWGCHISVWTAGLIWSAAAGTVSAGAGAAVGIAFTASAAGLCSDL